MEVYLTLFLISFMAASVHSDLSNDDMNLVVNEHNRYRKMVGASNMQKIYWDANLQAAAQAYANQCIFAHSTSRQGTGENIYAARFYQNSIVYPATRQWFGEGNPCNCRNFYQPCCGHYTQLSWAKSNRVGCGFAYCPNGIRNLSGYRYLLICHYYPTGNVLYPYNGQTLSRPAFEYGQACSACSSGMKCEDGLCI